MRRTTKGLLIVSIFVLINGFLANSQPLQDAAQKTNPRDLRVAINVSKRMSLTGNPIPLKHLVYRAGLTIVNEQLAEGITAVDLWADPTADGVSIRLSIIYNDVSNPEWWKDKKEKVLAPYTVREGETLRPRELLQFGIEPFELKVEPFVRPKPKTILPGEDFEIINLTQSFELTEIQRLSDAPYRGGRVYTLFFKNGYNKAINTVMIEYGTIAYKGGSLHDGMLLSGEHSTEPGALYKVEHLRQSTINKRVTIKLVLFTDGTFDGDETMARRFQAKWEGVKLQAPQALRMIEEALAMDDTQLVSEAEKIEARFWQMPEAIDKVSAIELLKTKYPTFDLKTISELYEDLKAGLYDTRNLALSHMGNLKRNMEQWKDSSFTANEPDWQARRLRELFGYIKTRYQKIIASLK
jgi:hypothetical protein